MCVCARLCVRAYVDVCMIRWDLSIHYDYGEILIRAYFSQWTVISELFTPPPQPSTRQPGVRSYLPPPLSVSYPSILISFHYLLPVLALVSQAFKEGYFAVDSEISAPTPTHTSPHIHKLGCSTVYFTMVWQRRQRCLSYWSNTVEHEIGMAGDGICLKYL